MKRACSLVGAVALVAGVAVVPIAVAVTPAGASSAGAVAYVVSDGDSGVTPVLLATNTPISEIHVGSLPHVIAITPDGKTAYVSNSGDNTVTPIATATNTTDTPMVATTPDAIAITPDGATAYVLDQFDSSVTPIDTASNIPGTPIPVGNAPDAIAITPDGKTAYVANNHDNNVTPINLATGVPGTPIAVGNSPIRIAITPDGATAYVTNNGDNTVTPITVATNTAGIPIADPHGPRGIAITPDGATAYVANDDGTVLPIDVASNSPATPISASTGALFGVAVAPDGATVYVTDRTNNALIPISTATNTPGTPISVGIDPTGVAITPDVAPVAVLTVTPAASGQPTQFSAAGSVATSSPIVSYSWNFGDGHTAVTSVPAVTHIYTSASTYTASVVETDAAGTSTTPIFTGQTMTRFGGPTARATARVDVIDCSQLHVCAASIPAGASPTTPAQTFAINAVPSKAKGTIQAVVAPSKLVCPKMDPTIAPALHMTDTGFAKSDHIKIAVTLSRTIRAPYHHVCFHSTVPFLSQSHPTTPGAGTALLLSCAQTKNVAPCVQSAIQAGKNIVVRLIVPGGDPVLKIVTTARAKIDQPTVPPGKVGKRYSAGLQTTGGLAPLVWKVSSGRLPKGVAVSAKTGLMTGTPTAKGKSTFVLQVADAEAPSETARMQLTITIK